MPRDSSSSDSDDAPARRNPIRRKSSDEDAPARRDNGDRRARLEARRRAAESSDDEEAPARKGRLDDEALTQRASTDARKRVDEASRDINEGLSAREMARRRVLARRKAREASNDSDADVENTGEQPVDPVNPRGDGRARALERRDRMKQADDALRRPQKTRRPA